MAQKYLTGKLLVATHQVKELVFERSVIYICAHNKNGAVGVVINNPIKQIKFSDIIPKANLFELKKDLPVYLGGPVEPRKGLVLHSDDFQDDSSVLLGSGLAYTSDLKLINHALDEQTPNRHMLIIGYAGWGFNQLNQEIKNGDWMVAHANRDIIFDVANDQKWETTLKYIGVNLANLSPYSGNC